MFDFDQIVKIASSALGALLLTTIAVGAAVGPATAGAAAPAAYAEAQQAGVAANG